MSDVDFQQVVADACVPVTEADALARLKQIALEENAPFVNQSPYSPFWRLVSLLMIKPLMWLVSLLSQEILPALFLKTATGQWVDLFAYQLGLERKAAVKARGIITLTRYSADGSLAVPVGTVIQSAVIAHRTYRMLTVEPASFLPGQMTLHVLAEAEDYGAAYNLATGFYALVSTALAGIASASNAAGWLIIPGADRETDEALKARCRNQFAAVNRWNIDAVYKALVAEYAGVGVDDIYIEHNAPRGPGTANIYILSDAVDPTPEWFQAVTNRIKADGSHGLGDDVLVMPIPTRAMPVALRIRVAGWLDAPAQAALVVNIKSFVGVALRSVPTSVGYSPTRVMPGGLFAWSQLIRDLHDAFPTLLSVDFLGTDDDLVTGLWIPDPQSISVEILP